MSLITKIYTILNCWIFRWKCWQRGGRIVKWSPEWPVFAGSQWEERILSESVTDRLHIKQGRSIGRRIFFHDDYVLIVYLKRHYHLPWYLRLLALLWPDRAWSPGLQEWEKLRWAAQQGWPVPRAVAAGQWVGPGYNLQSFIAIEELCDMLPLHEAIPMAAKSLSPEAFTAWKRVLFAEVARLVATLHQNYIFHKDLYLCHFYINESYIFCANNNMNNNIYFIDLHRLRRHRWSAIWWQVKDLAQFFFSCEINEVTSLDRQFFWLNYCKHMNIHSIREKFLYKLIMFKLNLYKRHERRRRKQLCRSLSVTSV
jgi:heptose I phosphotransferase